jgi:flagellar protein FliT
MRWMPTHVELYEEISLLSSLMVEAVRAHDWDRLIVLEREVIRLRNTLIATPEGRDTFAADLARKHALIQRILEDDAEVRRHTEPWMERVRQFLGSELSRTVSAGAGETAGN